MEWYYMYANTHAGTERLEWPDGGSYLSQMVVMVQVFGVIRDEIVKYRREKNG